MSVRCQGASGPAAGCRQRSRAPPAVSSSRAAALYLHHGNFHEALNRVLSVCPSNQGRQLCTSTALYAKMDTRVQAKSYPGMLVLTCLTLRFPVDPHICQSPTRQSSRFVHFMQHEHPLVLPAAAKASTFSSTACTRTPDASPLLQCRNPSIATLAGRAECCDAHHVISVF